MILLTNMKCVAFIATFSIVSSIRYNSDLEPEFSSMDASDLRKDQFKNKTGPCIVTDVMAEEVLNLDDSGLYEKYVEGEYLRNLNELRNETLIMVDKEGLLHKYTKTYLQRRLLSLAIPVANTYTFYLRKQGIKKPNETEADFRYNSNRNYLKKNILERLQHYYNEIIFRHLPKIKYKIIDEAVADKNGSMTRKHYHEIWEWETNFTIQHREIADHMSLARNHITTEADMALYAALKPAYFEAELNNIAFIAPPFEEHHFKINP
ncbi:hypothetical protein M8J76_006387 [Diaphorina citri]|nr:hypothetical protein M8J76_006387 [Diaphorina citri]KAI5748267.1 hypothetical protein M8J77_023638 [Diaphorina citri]